MNKWTNISVWALVILVVAALSGCGGTEEPKTLQVSAPMALAEARDVMYEEVVSPIDIVRLHATEALDYSVGDEAGDVFIAGLTDESAGVRFASAMAIGDHEYAAASDSLNLRLIEEESKMVRPGLIYATYRLGDTSRMSELSALLFDTNPWVRANAAFVMGKVNHPSAVDSLKNLLEDELNVDVKIRALESLAMLGDTRSAMMLEGFAKGQFVDDQIDAILGLARIGSDRGKIEFRRIYQSDLTAPVVKVAAVGALGRMDIFDQDGYEYCINAMNQPYTVLKDAYPKKEITPAEIRSLRQMAVTALGWMGRPLAVNDLYPLLKDRDGSVRVAAARSIYQLLPGSVVYQAYETPTPEPEPETDLPETDLPEDLPEWDIPDEEAIIPDADQPEVELDAEEEIDAGEETDDEGDVLPMMELVPAQPIEPASAE
jgi:HEAT repeat protein